MRYRRVSLKSILDVLGDYVQTTYGQIEDKFIDNLADASSVSESSLDWINPQKEDKQAIAEHSLAQTLLVDNTVIYSDILRRQSKTLIIVHNPKKALLVVGNAFFVEKTVPGIHPSAIIDPRSQIGQNVQVDPYAVIGRAIIGDGCHISSFVRIYDDVKIGTNCYIKEGAVLGGAGFGYDKDDNGNRIRFPQIGGLTIGDYVDIGANTCIDRGALSDTVIGSYTKIDNLVHIAHNVVIGQNAMIIACSEISGSCRIGDNAWVGPNSSVREWQHIGSNVLAGVGSVIVKDIPNGEIWAGNPARKIK